VNKGEIPGDEIMAVMCTDVALAPVPRAIIAIERIKIITAAITITGTTITKT